MTFNKAAIDVILKGLDPKFPHKTIGHDGLLSTTTESTHSPLSLPNHQPEKDPEEESLVKTVVAVTAESVATAQPAVEVEPAPKEETKELVAIEQPATNSDSKPVVVPVKTNKRAPKNSVVSPKES